jgi:hypothetical protein
VNADKVGFSGINEKLKAFKIDENGKAQIAQTTVSPLSTRDADGGEFRFGDCLRWYEWGGVLADAGTSIWESAALPEVYWKQDDPKYKDYPLHTPPTFAGVTDGAIDEIMSIPQLVKLGLDVTTDKEKAKAIWESVKKINLGTIKQIVTDKIDRYNFSDKAWLGYHEAGKDVVGVLTAAWGFAVKGGKLAEAVEETGNVALKEVRKRFVKSIDDAINKLKTKARYVLEGTGRYDGVGEHHPLMKAAFDGDAAYDYKKAFSVSPKTLDDAWKSANSGIPQNLHNKISGNQNHLYNEWTKNNPGKQLGIEDMAEIEIKAMTLSGIPEDVATGWVVKAMEDLAEQGVAGITRVPWN